MERRFDYVAVTPEEVAQELALHFPDCSVTSVETIGEGKINTNLLVHLSGSPHRLVLRLFTRGGELRGKEAFLYQRIAKKVPAPELLADTADRKIAGHPYLALSFIAGVSLAQILAGGNCPSWTASGEAVGQSVAQIHQIRFPTAGNLDGSGQVVPWASSGEDPFLYFTRLWVVEGMAGKRLGDTLRERFLTFIQSERSIMAEDNFPTCLVHGDCNPTNILVRSDDNQTEVTGIVDWEFAHSGTPLMDLANLLRDEENYPYDYVQGVIAGYESVAGKLPVQWRKQALFIDLLSHLEFLNSPEDRPEMHRTARHRLERTLEIWHSLP